ncbi:mitochondrial amidoxime-reducing component 1-like [Convolutriloba macropyga]|uniref:mitochondrial amidoxime-reducing component 1-like n=1 Tax=Convolutriloba macropyga TaxID=536237 RepID=UPI003F51EA67
MRLVHSTESSLQNVVFSISVGVGIGAVGLTAFFWNKRNRESLHHVGDIEQISIYPIKGLKGFKIGQSEKCPQVHVTQFGLKCGDLRDRCFVLGSCRNSKEKFEFITMRTVPKLALIDVEPFDSFAKVKLSVAGMEDIVVQFPEPTNEKLEVEMWKSEMMGTKCDESVNRWFRQFLKRDDVFLVSAITRRHEQTDRDLSVRNPAKDPKVGKYSPDDMRVIFNDSAPIMMITSVSHNDLNSKLKVKGRPEVQIDSWKSNIVLRCNLDQFPFCEDNWGKFSIAEEVTLDRVRLCHRCAVTKVDPKTGTFRKDEEPLRTLRSYRMHPAFKSPIFGSLLHVSTPGTIWVGMPVYAIEEKFIPLG